MREWRGTSHYQQSLKGGGEVKIHKNIKEPYGGCNIPHRRSTTVSVETYPPYSIYVKSRLAQFLFSKSFLYFLVSFCIYFCS